MLGIDFKKLSTLSSIAINFNTSKKNLQDMIDTQDEHIFYEEMPMVDSNPEG
ncbi:MAG: hypothetical protein PHV62_02835 [Sulfuricurvum sp.]|nr:hypothetical protein [Sulfuricurvum sp.]